MPDSRLDIPNVARWPERPLRDVCELISRGTAPVYVERSEVMAIGQRCVTLSGFDASKGRPHAARVRAGVLRPETGDVLLNSTGTGTIGRACVFDGLGSFVVDGHVTDLRPSAGSLDGRWLNAVLRSSWGQAHLERYCFSGSTNQVELNRLPLAGTRIPIPSLGEQRAAAAIHDTVDATIRQTEAIMDKLKQVKQGLLHDLLTRGIAANGELRPPQSQAPDLYRDSPLGWIPTEWDVGGIARYLDADSGIKPGPFGSSIKKENYSTTGFKVFGQEQVIAGDQDLGDYFVPLRKFQELQDFAVAPGDVLISLVGTIGKVLVLSEPLRPGLINPRLMRLRPNRREALPEFVGLLIASEVYARQVLANAGGGTMPVINKRIVSRIQVPVLPLSEQVEVWRAMLAADRRIDTEQETLAKLAKKQSGLMDDLLTGRVRVTPLLA